MIARLVIALAAISVSGSAVAEPVSARALIRPAAQATLSAGIAGQIIHLPKREGESFTAGQPLVSFNCGTASAALAAAQAALSRATARDTSLSDLARRGAAGSLDAAMAHADAAKAKAEVDAAQEPVNACTIAAPFSGYVTELRVHRYETVAVATPLLSIVSADQLEVSATVPGRWLAWLEAGQSFSLSVDETGETLPATITRINRQEDPVSQTVTIFGTLPSQSSKTMAGMSGTATFSAPAHPAGSPPP